MTDQEKIDNMVEHLKGFGSFQQMARFVLSLQDDDCPRCGGDTDTENTIEAGKL